MATTSSRFSRRYILVILVLAAAEAVLSLTLLSKSEELHAQIQSNLTQPASFTQQISLTAGTPTITLMKDAPFRVNTPWMYVSESLPLGESYVAKDLSKITVAQMAANERFRLEKRTNAALEKLFSAAEKLGKRLIVSSAYRSNADQKAIYESSLTKYGQSYTESHVADPGTSEHATGYAVDINTYSSGCELSGSGCSLSTADAKWLADTAPKFGFILRYPDGKQSETGVSYEPWHFRYIGSSAPTLTNKRLTLDRFVTNVTTGRYEDITSYY